MTSGNTKISQVWSCKNDIRVNLRCLLLKECTLGSNGITFQLLNFTRIFERIYPITVRINGTARNFWHPARIIRVLAHPQKL
jgi:hypothetical protein